MALDSDVKILEQVPLLSQLEPEALRLVAFACETRILRAGDILFSRGEMSDGGYIVVAGSIAIGPADDGNGPPAQVAGPQALIGEMALITQTERPTDAVALEASTVLKLPRTLFQRVLREFPRSAARLRASVGDRLIKFVDELDVARRQSFEVDEAPKD